MRIKLKFTRQPLMFSNKKFNQDQFRNFEDKNSPPDDTFFLRSLSNEYRRKLAEA
jgi:hypothetical protein